MSAFADLIAVKRDGGKHSAAEIDRIVLGFAAGDVPDYQMSAWLMAAYLNGLDADETVWLTDAMVRSGRRVDLSSVPGIKVDKHSTGGVADTVTLVACPIVAACGVPVAKMSGRGLGHTGGTLDKLESVPGFRTALSVEELIAQVKDVGIAVVAQTPDVDPADKAMYALRDVTATVASVPLIVGSIVSKKIAGGADAVLLDVKCGSGAFMKTLADARVLAAELVRVGEALGKRFACVITDMAQPLGDAVGNALEVEEAIATLRGSGPRRLSEASIQVAGRMLVLGGKAEDVHAGVRLASEAVSSGAAVDKLREWLAAQGGDPACVDDTSRLPHAARERVVLADVSGFVSAFDAEAVGRAAVALGAGRARKDEPIDPGAGLVLQARVGDRVVPGQPIAILHAADDAMLGEAQAIFDAAVSFAEEEPPASSLLLDG